MLPIEELFQRADDIGVRLEKINGLAVWERHPNLTHQKTIDRVRRSIKPAKGAAKGACVCLHVADLHIRFPDGSDKRPDIAIFCQEPAETETAVTRVPEAVIEIISIGYEAKDLEVGPPFYLRQGVLDVLVFDPYSQRIYHFDAVGKHEYDAPRKFQLQCGCRVTI